MSTQPPSNRFESLPDPLLRWFLRFIVLFSIALAFFYFYTLIPYDFSQVTQFTWRWFNPIIIAGLGLLIGILIVLNKAQRRSRVTLWFSIYISSVALFLVGNILSSSSITYESFTLWQNISAIGALFNGLLYFLFCMAYTKNEEHLYRPLIIIALAAPSLLLYAIINATLDNTHTYGQFIYSATWGFQQHSEVVRSPIEAAFVFWVYSFVILGIVLLVRYYMRSTQPIRRKQTKILLIGTILPFITLALAVSIKSLAPAFTILTSLGNTAQLTVMAYAILRYGLFNINPTQLADTILGTINEGVLAINPRYGIERANAAAAKFLHTTEQELEAKTLQEVFGEEVTKKIIQKFHSPNADALEVELKEHDTTMPVSMLSSTMANTDKSVAGYFLVFRDITKEHAVKAEIERQVVERTEMVHEEQIKLKTSIESLSLGFVMIDKDNEVILSNEAATQLLNAPQKELTLPGIAGCFEEGFDFEEECLKVRHSQKRRYIEKVKSGDKILRIFLTPVKYREDSLGIVALMEDITEAEILNRSKDEFFSIASHELRTPLTAIRGNASMIMDFYTDYLKDAQMKEMVYDIHESSTRLIDIVNDFLDVSRLEQGKVSYAYEEVALDEIIESVMYEMKAVLQEKHLSLTFDNKTLGVLPKVWADKNRLKQILYNLVGNSAKFTDKGGISIEAKVEGPLLKIYVSDTGRGISPEGQKLLFRKFQQTGGSLLTRDTTRGTGLGLYISKMMAENMRGTLALEHSEEGKGSTFSFTIPVASDEAKKTTEHQAIAVDTATGLSKVEKGSKTKPSDLTASLQSDSIQVLNSIGKLLIVEDDPYVVRLYQRLFSLQKLEVKTASNGKEGYELAKKFMPDIILLDVMMPVMNGLEALEKLKGDKKTKNIPVIMLSNLGEESTIRTAREKGALHYLIKSDFTPEQVFDEVERALHTTHKHKS